MFAKKRYAKKALIKKSVMGAHCDVIAQHRKVKLEKLMMPWWNFSRYMGVENVMKPRPKVNPFGDAKPREVLLEERGKDWQKIDLQLKHRVVDRA